MTLGDYSGRRCLLTNMQVGLLARPQLACAGGRPYNAIASTRAA